jgi:hypothetical protein
MSRARSLTKKELNERFYNAVDPEAAFVTEVQVGFHQAAVGRLVARRAAGLGKRRLKILELGASTCLFALAFLDVLAQLVLLGEANLAGVDYTAVEYSWNALETGLRNAVQHAFAAMPFDSSAEAVTASAALVATLSRPDGAASELSLVHSEAGRFVSESEGPFDVVILNELLDDLPCRVVHADADGVRRELSATARRDGPRWRVEVDATDAPPDAGFSAMPPGTVTATSEESLRLIRGIVERLERGGMLLVHDYGFTERFADVRQYAEPQPVLPSFVALELPELDGLPKSFFRVFGNDDAREVQITNDVGFAELIEELEKSGAVITLPHGNLVTTNRTWPELFFKGDGVFVSEFINLTADDDLSALLSELRARQAELRERYVTTYGNGRTAIFHDLIYVKD